MAARRRHPISGGANQRKEASMVIEAQDARQGQNIRHYAIARMVIVSTTLAIIGLGTVAFIA